MDKEALIRITLHPFAPPFDLCHTYCSSPIRLAGNAVNCRLQFTVAHAPVVMGKMPHQSCICCATCVNRMESLMLVLSLPRLADQCLEEHLEKSSLSSSQPDMMEYMCRLPWPALLSLFVFLLDHLLV